MTPVSWDAAGSAYAVTSSAPTPARPLGSGAALEPLQGTPADVEPLRSITTREASPK